MNEDTQVFAQNFTDVSSVKSQQNSAALFDFTHRVINDHTPSGDVQLAAGAAGSMKFKVPDDQAVIFKIKGIGVITLYSLQEWNVHHQDILTSTQLPDFIDGNSEAIIRPAMQDLFLRSGETLTLTSPPHEKIRSKHARSK
ncbi:hypothetical protein [Arcanobacterium hippocoleae]|uniref:hypothetical protein n=1 Tax=Arcanobacterium hippocoleae TaxID=149017 RepID=UPI00333F5808